MNLRFILFLLFVPSIAIGQNFTRNYQSCKELTDGVTITTSDGEYTFYAYSSKIIETIFVPINELPKGTSHAVTIKHRSEAFNVHKTEKQISFSKDNGIEVRIEKSPFKLSYWYKGKEIISEKTGYYKDGLDKIEFNLTKDEILYGGGARALGMNRRGNRLQLYNRAHYGYEEKAELMNYCMPLVLSNKVYAVHFDNASIGYLDLDSKKNNTLTYETINGRKVYQVVVGDDWKDLLKEYTFLTGRQPMPPRWAFGNFASRFGYHSEAEARNVVDQFRKDSIPLDAIIFDLYWFGKDIQGTLGNLEFYKDSFPSPEKMISDFRSQNVKTVLITEPFILTTSKKWQEAVDKKLLGMNDFGKPYTYDFYFGNTGLLDIYQPQTREWFWNIYLDMVKMGVKGFWGDLGEPEVHPSRMYHGDKMADEVHNIYGHDWARLISEGYKKYVSEERPFILMRSGYSGTQKYGIIPWSGDVNRTWGGLKPQMEISMQMGLQGIGYMHSDLGGFAGANDDPELYTRWLQYGVFQPIFRPHAQEEVPSEPIFKDEKTKLLAKKAIELRYQMLPYNYTLAFENHLNGTPLMRPVFMEDSSAHRFESTANTYMWGDAFLVYPITDKQNKDSADVKAVSLPSSSVWFDFHTGKKVQSDAYSKGEKQTISLQKIDLSHIPVFVKAGSFVPMSKTIQSTEAYQSKNVNVHYYFDASVKSSQGQWYEDDGTTTNAFEKGYYSLLKMSSSIKKSTSTISFQKKPIKEQNKTFSSFDFTVHFSENAPKKVSVDGKSVDIKVNNEKKYFTIPLSVLGNTTNVKIQW